MVADAHGTWQQFDSTCAPCIYLVCTLPACAAGGGGEGGTVAYASLQAAPAQTRTTTAVSASVCFPDTIRLGHGGLATKKKKRKEKKRLASATRTTGRHAQYCRETLEEEREKGGGWGAAYGRLDGLSR